MIIPDIVFSAPKRNNPHLQLEDYAMTPDESAVSKDDGTVVAVESWIQKNGWHKELRSKLEAVGHERPRWSDQMCNVSVDGHDGAMGATTQ